MISLSETSCTTCGKAASPPAKYLSRWSPTASGLLILILPKCPFCIVAYTSSMAICGAPALLQHHTDWGAWLALTLAVICLYSLARNFRGNGTYIALALAIIGLALLGVGLFTPNAMSSYYAGAALLLVSSIYNGPGYRRLNRKSPVSPIHPTTNLTTKPML